VIWVKEDTPFGAIAAALRQYRVSAFPVLNEQGQVIGVVSESDLLTKLALGGGEDQLPGMITGILHHKRLEKARGVTAGDLMTTPPVTVSPEDTVEHAAQLMYVRGVKRLPVGVRQEAVPPSDRNHAESEANLQVTSEEPCVPVPRPRTDRRYLP